LLVLPSSPCITKSPLDLASKLDSKKEQLPTTSIYSHYPPHISYLSSPLSSCLPDLQATTLDQTAQHHHLAHHHHRPLPTRVTDTAWTQSLSQSPRLRLFAVCDALAPSRLLPPTTSAQWAWSALPTTSTTANVAQRWSATNKWIASTAKQIPENEFENKQHTKV
jgi:hypothetical protein